MPKALCIAAATLLLAPPAIAQNLSTEASPYTFVGDLLIHSGTFSAERSVVEERVSCQAGQFEQREQTSRVWFNPTFLETPHVIVSLNSFDLSEDRNARLETRAVDVNPYYMTLVVSTWCDTNLYRARGTYTVMGAIGERF